MDAILETFIHAVATAQRRCSITEVTALCHKFKEDIRATMNSNTDADG